MDISQIILGRPWLYDNDVTIHGQSNMCRFEHESKKIKLTHCRPIAKKPKPNAPKKSKRVNLISATTLDEEIKNGAPWIILAASEVVKMSDSTILPEVTPVIEEFSDVFLEDLPNKLPAMHDIQHAIDLVTDQLCQTCYITEWT